MVHFLGNTLLILTYLRILIGVSILSQNVLWGFGAVIPTMFLVAYWERKSPTQGKRRLVRGVVIFLTTVVVDVITYAFF